MDVIGLEPTTPSMSRRYSNQLSYTSVFAYYIYFLTKYNFFVFSPEFFVVLVDIVLINQNHTNQQTAVSAAFLGLYAFLHL